MTLIFIIKIQEGLILKQNLLLNTSFACSYSIIACTETWLTISVNSTEFRVLANLLFINVVSLLLGFRNTVVLPSRYTYIFFSSGLNLKNMSAIKNLPSSDIIGVKFNVQYISFYLIIIYIPFNTFFAVYNELFDTLSMLDYLYCKNII